MEFPKLSGKAWVGVIAGGVGLGFLLRKRKGSQAGTTSASGGTSNGGVDLSTYGLASSSMGNAASAGQGSLPYAGTDPTSPNGSSYSPISAVQQDLLDQWSNEYADYLKGRLAGNPAVPPNSVPSTPTGTTGSSTVAPPSQPAPADPLARLYGKFVDDGAGNFFAVYGPGSIVNETWAEKVAHDPAGRLNDLTPAERAALQPYLGSR